MSRQTKVFFSAVAAATSLTSFAAEAPKTAPAVTEERSFSQRDTLTGDWFGARTVLEKRGIKFDLFFTDYYAGLFAGGVADQSFEFGGRADALIRIDTDKLGLWDGGGFQVHVESRFGDSASRSAPRSGGLWPPNSGVVLPLGEPERLVASSLFFRQKIGSSAVLMLGKVNVVDLLESDPFFGGWGVERFSNIAFVAPPSGVVPPTIIGGILSYQIKPLSFTLMVFDPSDRTDDYWPEDLFDSGTNISLAATWSGEIAGRKSSIGVTGTYSTKRAANLADLLLPGELKTGGKEGSYNIAFSLSHLLYQSPTQPGKGLGIYAKGAIADGNPNPIQASVVGGFAGHGVVPGRPRDTFGIGYYYYDFSNDLQDAVSGLADFNDEQGLEAFYNFAVTPWFRLTADVQLIRPARGNLDEAWVGELRASIRF